MGRAEPLPEKLTQAEYLARERAAEFKSEFYKGEIFPMWGAGRRAHFSVGKESTEKLSQAEYLERERVAEFKSEYFEGNVFEMQHGERIEHVSIVSNLLGELRPKLKECGCNMLSHDMRVHVRQNTLYTYPDLVVFCGEPEFLDGEFDTLMNPTAIIEVLSESTRDYDTGTKFSLYRGIPTLGEYILIDSQQRQIERWYRADGTWHLDPNTAEQLTVAKCSMSADEVYESVNFAA